MLAWVAALEGAVAGMLRDPIMWAALAAAGVAAFLRPSWLWITAFALLAVITRVGMAAATRFSLGLGLGPGPINTGLATVVAMVVVFLAAVLVRRLLAPGGPD